MDILRNIDVDFRDRKLIENLYARKKKYAW